MILIPVTRYRYVVLFSETILVHNLIELTKKHLYIVNIVRMYLFQVFSRQKF